MKQQVWMIYAILALAALPGEPQEFPADRTTVPFSDPSRPGTVKVALLNGGIQVRGYSGKEVLVEARGSGQPRRESRTPRTDGLHRLADPTTGLSVEEQDNVIAVSAGHGKDVSLVLQVPVSTSLNLKCVNGGDILVENVAGEVDANNLNGAVTLRNISGTAVAHALNSNVTVTFDRVTAGKAMSFSSFNGNIDVTLPADTKARVKMKTDNGEIYTDFDIKLEPGGPPSQTPPDAGGRHRLRFDKAFHGSINGGGPEMQFTTFNGKIYIRKKK